MIRDSTSNLNAPTSSVDHLEPSSSGSPSYPGKKFSFCSVSLQSDGFGMSSDGRFSRVRATGETEDFSTPSGMHGASELIGLWEEAVFEIVFISFLLWILWDE